MTLCVLIKYVIIKYRCNVGCPLSHQHAPIFTDNLITYYTAHLVLVTAAVVYGLCKEWAPEHEEECTPLPPSD